MMTEYSDIYLPHRTVSPTTALLLDVENFSLKINLEKYLRAYCVYPITIKIAVANWQSNAISNSKLDLYLHKQRYQLVHVPQGKNAADAQIMTLGISYLTQHPQIKEVVIVSHDSIFDYLHKSLMTFGCKTYKVFQQSGNVYIHDWEQDRTNIIRVEQETIKEKTNSPENKLVSQIKSIIAKNSDRTNKEITINTLAQEYKQEHNLLLSQAIKQQKLGGSIIKFLKNSCTNNINIEQKDNIYYLSLK